MQMEGKGGTRPDRSTVIERDLRVLNRPAHLCPHARLPSQVDNLEAIQDMIEAPSLSGTYMSCIASNPTPSDWHDRSTVTERDLHARSREKIREYWEREWRMEGRGYGTRNGTYLGL